MDCIPAELFNMTYDVTVENGNQTNPGYDVTYELKTPNSSSSHGNGSMDKSVFGLSAEEQMMEQVETVLYSYVIVGICGFGLLGNILNLVVLTSKGLQKTMDRMEKSAHCGLVAMAVSDMCFCLGKS